MWNMFTAGWCSAISLALMFNGELVGAILCAIFALANYMVADV